MEGELSISLVCASKKVYKEILYMFVLSFLPRILENIVPATVHPIPKLCIPPVTRMLSLILFSQYLFIYSVIKYTNYEILHLRKRPGDSIEEA